MKIFSLLQRELFREIALITSICLSAFLGIILLGRLLQLRELFLGQGVSFWALGKLFVYLSPFFLLLLVPVSCMLGLFLTVLRMGADRELISLRASGLSFWNMLPAPLSFAFLCTGVTLWISLSGISWGMENFRATLIDLARQKTSITLQPGVFNTSFPHLTLYARTADPVSGELQDIFVLDSSRKNTSAIIVSPKGRIDSNAQRGALFFRLENGSVYRERDEEFSVVNFQKYILTLDMSRLFGGVDIGDKAPKEMSWEELQRLAAEKNEDVAEYRRVLIEQHKRFALPLACLVLGLFALPLGFALQGMKRQYGLIFSLSAFFIYYLLLSAGISLAKGGTLSPGIAMWTPNVLFLGFGISGCFWVVREKELVLPDLLRVFRRWWRKRS